MAKDNDEAAPKPDASWNLDDWDLDDTFLAERPNVSRDDLKIKKQIPRDRLVSEAEKVLEQRWEHQLEDLSEPSIRRKVAHQEEAADEKVDDDDEHHEVVKGAARPTKIEDDDGTFFDSMSVLKQILILRKRQSAKLGKPATEAELVALAHETLERLSIDLDSNMDYIAAFVAKVIGTDIAS